MCRERLRTSINAGGFFVGLRYEEETLAGLHSKESSRTAHRQESADVDADNDQGELEL
jgi:hypothetical protein